MVSSLCILSLHPHWDEVKETMELMREFKSRTFESLGLIKSHRRRIAPFSRSLTFSVEHSIEEVLGLSLQLADPRPLLLESFRQNRAAVVRAELLQSQTRDRELWKLETQIKLTNGQH